MQKMIKIFIVTMLVFTFLMPIINGNDNKINRSLSLTRTDPDAPNPPTISGPKEGKLHVKYTYEITSEDPQCDKICYTIRCSDIPAFYNSQLCESGYRLIYNHSWDDFYQTESPFSVMAKATDCHGHESEWSTFEIYIKNKIINKQILEIIWSKFPILKNLL